eukprot:765988-Hanusia_phi.AAC.15
MMCHMFIDKTTVLIQSICIDMHTQTSGGRCICKQTQGSCHRYIARRNVGAGYSGSGDGEFSKFGF